MRVACNYYPETEQLLDEEAIDLDYFKYPALGYQMKIMEDLNAFEQLCSRLTKKRPVLLHGLYPAPHDLSSPLLRAGFEDSTADRLIKMTGTPGVSFHPTLTYLPKDEPFEKTLSVIIENGIFLREKYKDMEFVSLENMDGEQWGDLLKPQVISKIIEETGCGFLLDISHAYCASRLTEIPFWEYLHMLPLDKTVEIHINGWITKGDDVMCHTKIHEEAYRALKEVLRYSRPGIVTVEYGRDNDRIKAGIPVLTPGAISKQAKTEIAEQISRIRKICG